MAYSDPLADKIRIALAHVPNVEEKKMFGGIAFIIGGKMCMTVGIDRIMCRIDPGLHEKAVKRPGCRTVVMKGRPLKGYVYVHEDRLQSKTVLNYWIGLALDFNKKIQER
jgi:TfoX/Sxy family transcriptional regulator of competence genes